MAEFQFHKHPGTNKPVVLAPRRAHRTNEGGKKVAVCPFCPGQEDHEDELYRVQKTQNTQKTSGSENLSVRDSEWAVRVIPNKFPFTPHHELIVHSPDHHKNIDELPFEQVELLFQTYRERFNFHMKGPHFAKASRGKQVYLFHNRGHAAGESLPHPHTQLTVIPRDVKLDILPLDMRIYKNESGIRNQESSVSSIIHNSLFMIPGSKNGKRKILHDVLETDHFLVFCPPTSDWPDEVWVAPKKQRGLFGSITDAEVTDMAFVLSRLIQIFDLRHGYEFPFNFYIAPHKQWYVRLVPRLKILGGFEVGTNVIVNTQDPRETFAFIAEHFWQPNPEKIKGEHQAEYLKSV